MSDKVIVTGAAGFIGYHLCGALLGRGAHVIGVDNLNDYYSVRLKEARLSRLKAQPGFVFHRNDIADAAFLRRLFDTTGPDYVFHLAAQAGVRYSLENPFAYARSNLDGFLSVLEAARAAPPKHLIFASTSSVYGANRALPFQESSGTEHPLTLYAATKKANEVMAHTYAHLFGTPMTGVRFFTVYGPWGRPDMALFIFAKAISEGRPVPLFNGGAMQRDFTYIDDIIDGLLSLMLRPPAPDPAFDAIDPDPAISGVAPYRIVNIGRGKTEPLTRYLEIIERELGLKATIESLPMQQGDVPDTWADTARLTALTGFSPKIDIDEGVSAFVQWFRDIGGALA